MRHPVHFLTFLSVLLPLSLSSCGEKGPATITPPPIVNPGGGSEGGGGGSSEGGDKITEAKVGSEIPAWQKGVLDVHFINTTTGEAIFLIFPDGTQMLVDAAGSQVSTGQVNSTTNTGIRSRWDPTKESNWLTGKFIEQYIRFCQKWTGNAALDYVLLTHFHNDHFGGANGLPASTKGSGYTQQSLPYIMDSFTVGKLMDRGYPEYDYPFDMATKADNASNCANYIKAVKWHVANNGLKAEKFIAGSDSQIVPVKGSVEGFKVQNIAVNGEIWTGKGTATRKTFPEKADIKVADPKNVTSSDNCPQENHTSCMAKVTYGKFDLWLGGDAQYNGLSSYSWKDIETAVAQVCGKVEVMKADHHGTDNTNGTGYKDMAWAMRYFMPQCWIVNSWTDGHPRQGTFEGVTGYCTGTDVYITNTCTAQKAYTGFASRVKSTDGHIVVRVVPGGGSYYIYTLSDSDRKMTVKAINGPYTSK